MRQALKDAGGGVLRCEDGEQVAEAAGGEISGWCGGCCWCSRAAGRTACASSREGDGTAEAREPASGKGFVDYSLRACAEGATSLHARWRDQDVSGRRSDQALGRVQMDLTAGTCACSLARDVQGDYEFRCCATARVLYEHRRSHFATVTRRRSSSRRRWEEAKRTHAVVAGCGRQSRLVAGRDPDPLHSHVDADDLAQAQIFTIAADGSDRRQLTHFPDETFVGSSSYSPDGAQISSARPRPAAVADVLVMNADGSDLHPLVADSAWDSAPDWGTG